MGTVGKPLLINDHPEPDGTHRILVHISGQGNFEVAFPEADAVHFVRVLQEGFVRRQSERKTSPRFPRLEATQVDLAHGPQGTELLIDTLEMGRLALAASDEFLLNLKSEIDRALAMRGAARH